MSGGAGSGPGGPPVPGPPDDLPAEAVRIVRGRTDLVPTTGIVLGSGLGPALADDLEVEASFDFADLPGLPPPTVPGHAGRLLLGRLAGEPVATFSGRVHVYEGHGMDAPALLPRIAHDLGARTFVATGAVGALVPELAAGTIVVCHDHVNLMGTTPLRGWRYPDGTPAFVGMRDVYDADVATLAEARAVALDIPVARGVYAAVAGPAYETPAEVGFLRGSGATVVGMSMVPEVVPARALRMRILGLLSVTNELGTDVEHDEIVRISNRTAADVGRLLIDLLPRLEPYRDGEADQDGT